MEVFIFSKLTDFFVLKCLGTSWYDNGHLKYFWWWRRLDVPLFKASSQKVFCLERLREWQHTTPSSISLYALNWHRPLDTRNRQVPSPLVINSQASMNLKLSPQYHEGLNGVGKETWYIIYNVFGSKWGKQRNMVYNNIMYSGLNGVSREIW